VKRRSKSKIKFKSKRLKKRRRSFRTGTAAVQNLAEVRGAPGENERLAEIKIRIMSRIRRREELVLFT